MAMVGFKMQSMFVRFLNFFINKIKQRNFIAIFVRTKCQSLTIFFSEYNPENWMYFRGLGCTDIKFAYTSTKKMKYFEICQ